MLTGARSWLLWEEQVKSGPGSNSLEECRAQFPRHTDPISPVSAGSSVERKNLGQTPFHGACGDTGTQRGTKLRAFTPSRNRTSADSPGRACFTGCGRSCPLSSRQDPVTVQCLWAEGPPGALLVCSLMIRQLFWICAEGLNASCLEQMAGEF